MSVRIVENESKAQGKGWQVSRRAFLAQSTAFLVALGIPAKQASAMAGKLYQAKDAALAGDGYVDKVINAMTERVTKSIDPTGNASIQLFVKQVYEDAGLPNFDAEISLAEYIEGASSKTIADFIEVSDPSKVTVADVLARMVTKDVTTSLEGGLASAADRLRSSYQLPQSVQQAIDSAFSVDAFKASLSDIESNDPLQLFLDPERALIAHMLDTLPSGQQSIDFNVNNAKMSVGLKDNASKFNDEIINVILANWQEVQFDQAEFAEARALVHRLSAGIAGLDKVNVAASAVLHGRASAEDVVRAGIDKSRELLANPAALNERLESDLADAQDELADVLAKADALNKLTADLPLQYAENVPGTRYILSDSGGVIDQLAATTVEELNRVNDRAGELAQKIVQIQNQMEGLHVAASDGRTLGEKLVAIEFALNESTREIRSAANEMQFVSEGIADKDVLAKVAAAVEEAQTYLELNKDEAVASLSGADWAAVKSFAALMSVQNAQMRQLLAHGLQVNEGQSAFTESLRLFGRWNAGTPVEELNKLFEAQLALRTEKAATQAVAFVRSLRDSINEVAGSLNGKSWEHTIAHVISASLQQSVAGTDTTLADLGVSNSTTIQSLVAASNASLPSRLQVKKVQETACVTALASAIAEKVAEAASAESSLSDTLGALSTAEIAASNLHLVAFQTVRAFAKAPVTEAISNYLNTLVQGAYGDGNVNLAAYADLDAATVKDVLAKSETKKAVVAQAKPNLDSASRGMVALLLPNVLGGLSVCMREIIDIQAKKTLDVTID